MNILAKEIEFCAPDGTGECSCRKFGADPVAANCERWMEAQQQQVTRPAAKSVVLTQPYSINILALDLGTTSGWARCARDGTIAGGREKFAPKRMEAAGQRWLKFRAFLGEQRAAAGEIHAVYYEDIKMHKGVIAAHVYGGFKATLEAWCATNNVRMVGVGFGAIKKHWTGKGNADKQTMIVAAVAKGFNPVDDNHADALAILSLARQLEGQQVEQPIPF